MRYFKTARKILFVALCVTSVFMMYSIIEQVNYHSVRLQNRRNWILSLEKNISQSGIKLNLSDILDALNYKAKQRIQNNLPVPIERETITTRSYVGSVQAINNTVETQEHVDENDSDKHSKTDDKIVSLKERYVQMLKNLSLEDTNDIKLDIPAENKNSNIEVDAELDEIQNVEDEYNEFDITDLDVHIAIEYINKLRPYKKDKETYLDRRRQLKWSGNYEETLNNTPEYRKRIYDANFRSIRNQRGINCTAIINNNESAISNAYEIMEDKPQRIGITADRYARTSDCENFRGGRGYIEHPLSQMELNFPLAFGIAVYRDVEQAERLLRAIYRPHNFYCIHLDSKMLPVDRMAIEKIAGCLDNVFIPGTSLNVTWGEFSVLELELVCMNNLWPHKRWKYYINLTGQEYPLKTNRELVAILQSLEGANIVDGTWIRAKEIYFYRWTQAGNPPPHKIRPIKGSVHVAVNRAFVDFALHDQRAFDFLQWLKKTQIPDETFFASLNHNPHLGINGSFLGEAEEYPLKPSLMRYKNWEFGHSVFVRSCSGKYVRNVCVLGIGDLHKALNDVGLFANKFHIDYEYLALDCIEEYLHERTWYQYLHDVTIDTTYYSHLDYVKKKLFVPP